MKDKGISKKALGDFGENLAVDYLEKAGLQIIKRNYRCPKGEIDIIALTGETLVCIEVRGRTSDVRGCPEESITAKKLHKLTHTLAYYIMERGYRQWPAVRIDLLAIRYQGEGHTINWVKGIS